MISGSLKRFGSWLAAEDPARLQVPPRGVESGRAAPPSVGISALSASAGLYPQPKSDTFFFYVTYRTFCLISEEFALTSPDLQARKGAYLETPICIYTFGKLLSDKLAFLFWCDFCSWFCLTFHLVHPRVI